MHHNADPNLKDCTSQHLGIEKLRVFFSQETKQEGGLAG
jgi:hypothetical protein